MKISAIAFLLILPVLPAGALTLSYDFNGINMLIPDGNPTGLADTRTIPAELANIDSLSIRLDIAGDFNGDLYAYVTHSGGFSVLLNRVGRTSTDPFGYDDSGFSVMFSDTGGAGDIHVYRDVTTPTAGFPLTGSWQPDARDVDPDTVTEASLRSAYLSSFSGLDPSGSWTLFLADLSGGSPHSLQNWSLVVTGDAVPEPGTALLFGLGACSCLLRRPRKPHRESIP